MTDATEHRVWMVYEEDLSHGIYGIFGVYSSQEKAEACLQAVIDSDRNSFDVQIQDWPVDV